MCSSVKDDFEICEDFLEDLSVMKNRAGGGMPTYLYKAQKIKDALDAVEENEVFLFSDVDVQFFRPVQSIVEASMENADLVLQREFDDIGVNIGFVGLRNSSSTRAFWTHVRSEIERTQALDQRVVNNTLYSGFAQQEFGLIWDRFPSDIWASSMAYSGVAPESIAVHHANFTLVRAPSYDHSIKLSQMATVRRFFEGDSEEMLEFVRQVRENLSMLDYRDRHFGARRPGPEWTVLPAGHLARPGGFREKRAKSKAAVASTPAQIGDSSSLEEGRSTVDAGTTDPLECAAPGSPGEHVAPVAAKDSSDGIQGEAEASELLLSTPLEVGG